ncbi:hypothetical protein DFQ12_1433 [Sphingobacterium detergens]|uniref:Uncharacterized protein n=2 Tax=Sphingobacteriaceae TaxID=84566 RepID=A0A420BIP0_SPHD1|nr:hypothetical protein DFQ12_1433 [Sphingobacterium detergens]
MTIFTVHLIFFKQRDQFDKYGIFIAVQNKTYKKPIKMKKIAFLALCVILFAGCNNAQQPKSAEKTDSLAKEETPSIGGDKDEHGCLVGAGQTWSEVKQGCIQVFNVGTRLNPVDVKEGDAIISAFVVANDDKSKMELFLPDDNKTTIILDKTENNTYQKDTYKYDADKSDLYVNGAVKYKGEVKK